MSAAILGARLAAGTILDGAPFDRYASGRAVMLRDIVRLTGFLLRLSRRPSALDRALTRFGRRPELLQKLLGIASGVKRWKDMTLREKIYLGTGF